ncbi:MAG: hypothetical protein QOD49_1360, partial [Actinomycetota bacterium]|nr:hypothetical protein [Actinomycetota bacterium]
MASSPRWSRIVTVIAGGALAALGLAIIVGWHTQSRLILQPLPGLIAPVYNTALSFLLCGLGLMAIALGRPVLALPCGGVVLILASLNLVEHGSGADLGIDQLLMVHFITTKTSHPGRMAPNSAVCFFLAAIALLLEGGLALERRRPPVLGLLGSIVEALGVVALSGYLMGVKTYGWGSFLPMAPQTATGFAVLGAGVMAVAWSDGRSEAVVAPRWLPIPVGVGALTATLCLWQPLVAQRHDQVERTVEAELDGIKKSIGTEIEARVFPLSRMARRWEKQGKPSREAWEMDAELITDQFADLRDVVWVDSTLNGRWSVPAEVSQAERDRDFAGVPRWRQVLTEARDRRIVKLLSTAPGPRGGPLLLIAAPIFAGREGDGWILGVIRLRDFFHGILTEDLASGYAITVSEGGVELFGRDDAGRHLAGEWGRERGIDARGISWRVRVWPRPEQLARSLSSVPEAVMVTGLLMALLLAWAVHVAQTSGLRAREVESSNRRLG